MTCCRKVIPDKNQQKIIDRVNQQNQTQGQPSVFIPNTSSKSNRAPAGYIARQCNNCGTKTISIICPTCQNKLQ